jgi:peptide/nickel transport system substrate-binding protein
MDDGLGSAGRWSRTGRRGLSPVTAGVVMLIVIVVVGAGAYVGFQGTNSGPASSTQTVVSCAPPTDPACAELSGGHDVLLSTDFETVSQGQRVPFAALYTGGQAVSYYNYSFGDGNFTNTTSPLANHTYAYPGTYLVTVQARIHNAWHDNYLNILVLHVIPSHTLADSDELPTVGGTIVGNGTAGAVSPTAVLLSGGTITLNGSYTAAPTDPVAQPLTPTISIPSWEAKSVDLTSVRTGAQFANTTAKFNASGIYTIAMVGGGSVTNAGTTTTYTQEYVWTVFVAQAGFHAGFSSGTGTSGSRNGAGTTYTSPHPGLLSVYEYTPGGSVSEDPSLDYESSGYEPILNVYQTLIQYNGSETGTTYSSFNPVLATCVPGSPECQRLYGAGFTGISSDGRNFTFVIDPNARFYDPAGNGGAGASWPVYPSDVVFSLIRTMSFSVLPNVESNNGWILTQSLLSKGNGSWDGDLHGAYNTTPAQEFSVFQVNDSAFCPAAAMTEAHGCVTIDADADGMAWPFFLELISDAFGSSIEPCGWFTSQGSGIPGWTNDTPADSGDHPCTLPGGATTTNSTAYRTAVAAMSPTSWDWWETYGSQPPFLGDTQWKMVGSGPYYLADLDIGNSYLLKANPAYAQPLGCPWANSNCDPLPKSYAGTVDVVWETTPTAGEQAYQAGVADFSTVPIPDLSFLLKLVDAGGVSLESVPTISINFFPFNLDANITGASSLVSSVNIPPTFLDNVGLRQFLVHAYPYATAESTIATRDNIQFYINYGGAIPHYMADYYQGNISWPAGDPNGSASTPGTASWYWAQLSNSSSPYYDPYVASSCTTSDPCVLPMIGELGSPDVDQRITAWTDEIASLSGGRIQMDSTDVTFGTLVTDSLYEGPGQNPLPVYNLGWAPDYPDPTDYVGPLYIADGAYGHPDAVNETLDSPTNAYGTNSPSCTNATDLGYWVDEANGPGIANDCQGSAYHAMQIILGEAANEANLTQRLIDYWQAESIANGLALYVYWDQNNAVISYASWINGSSLNTNVCIGGGGSASPDQLWYDITGNGVAG